ncbi:hypothetical protein ATK86_3989 [Nocardia fluminea]|uniref:Uncharacterized protein n=1 Tax=Nocardia fluminea TaxID=134984 RepID=A0A2N3VDC4_9NOCA|nr:hypothetical protein ATK86_3989 [Nocardia fluminea]
MTDEHCAQDQRASPAQRSYYQRCATCQAPIAPLQADKAVGVTPPRQWVDKTNNVHQFDPVDHEHSPSPLCSCGHTAEQSTGRPGRCGVFKCTCTDHPAPDLIPRAAPIDWAQVGQDAHARGEPAAPALNSSVREAIAGMAVGGGAAEIMRTFLDGWNQAQALADIATAMADNAEVAAAIGPVTTARLISIATDLYDTYGDPDDILSTGQLDTLERLRLHPDPSDGRSPAIRPWDVIAIAVTAMELADQHGLRDASLWEVIDCAYLHIHTGPRH